MIAPSTVGNAIAVTDVEAGLATVAPDRQLNESREDRWKARIEAFRIDAVGKSAKQIRTIPNPIASWSVRMLGLASLQNASAVQEIVDQRVDDDEARADFEPMATASSDSE